MVANESNTTNGPVIEAAGVSRVFGSGDTAVTALSTISLNINQGEFLAVTGRSGSGKTTLLRIVAGLEFPSNGRILFNGEDTSSWPVQRRRGARRR